MEVEMVLVCLSHFLHGPVEKVGDIVQVVK